MKKSKKISEFEVFEIKNLQSLLGGEIITFNTGVNSSYPQGDHKDLTYDEYGRESLDGFGGGRCEL